jgi:hypothetical protein
MHPDRSLRRRPPRGWFPVLLLVLAACSIANPAAPSWEVTLNLPLFNDTYQVLDLLDEGDFAPIGSDSLYTYTFEETLDRIEVGSDLTLDAIDETVATEIGTFTVPAASGDASALVDLTDLDPSLLSLSGPTALPAFSFSGVEHDLTPLENFSAATIASGTIDITVTNATEVAFDTLVVELLDHANGDALVRTVTIADGSDPLQMGESVTLVQDLSGLSISNTFRIRLRGASPGGTADLDNPQQLQVEAIQGELEVSSATAEVEAIDFDTVETLALTDAAQVTSATLDQGTLTLSFTNNLAIPLELDVTLPQLTDAGGTPVSFTLNPGPPGPPTVSVQLDLSDHRLTPVTGTGGGELEVEVHVHSDGSGGSEVTLEATDTVEVQASLDGLVLSEVSGVLDPTMVEVPEGSFTFWEENGNLLEELRKVSLGAVRLAFTFQHTIDFPADIHLDFVGEGGVPDPVSFSLDIPIPAAGPAATPADPAVTVIAFDESTHPELLVFLSAVPTTVRYSGSATVGDDTYTVSAAATDYFEVSAAFSVPAVLNIDESITIEPDIEYMEEGIDPETADRIQEASLSYEISSTLDLPVSIRLFIAADSLAVFSAPDIEIALRVSGASQVGQDTTAVLTREQWEVLGQPFYTGVRVTIPPSGGTPLEVTSRDRLFLKAFATVRVLVEPGKGSGGGR